MLEIGRRFCFAPHTFDWTLLRYAAEFSASRHPAPDLEYVGCMRATVVRAAELPEETGLDGEPVQQLQGQRLLPVRLVGVKEFHCGPGWNFILA
jgi:hypothetical protein